MFLVLSMTHGEWWNSENWDSEGAILLRPRNFHVCSEKNVRWSWMKAREGKSEGQKLANHSNIWSYILFNRARLWFDVDHPDKVLLTKLASWMIPLYKVGKDVGAKWSILDRISKLTDADSQNRVTLGLSFTVSLSLYFTWIIISRIHS